MGCIFGLICGAYGSDYVYFEPSALTHHIPRNSIPDYKEFSIYRVNTITGEIENFLEQHGEWFYGGVEFNDRYVVVDAFSDSDVDSSEDDRFSLRVLTHNKKLIREIHDGIIGKINPSQQNVLAYKTKTSIVIAYLDDSLPDKTLDLKVTNVGSIKWDYSGKYLYYDDSLDEVTKWCLLDGNTETYKTLDYPVYESPNGQYSFLKWSSYYELWPGIIFDSRGEILFIDKSWPQPIHLIRWLGPHLLFGELINTFPARSIVLDCSTGKEWHFTGYPITISDNRLSIVVSPDKIEHYFINDENAVPDGLFVRPQCDGKGIDYGPSNSISFLCAPKLSCNAYSYEWTSNMDDNNLNYHGAHSRVLMLPYASQSHQQFTCTYIDCDGEKKTFVPVTVNVNEKEKK